MRTIVISGGTDGMGNALARTYLSRGHTVVILGRDPGKGEAFRAAAGGAGERAVFLRADLSLVAENRRIIEALTARFPVVDALILCARHHRSARRRTAEGFEGTFALFNWSNLGLVLAVKGAALLRSIGLTGLGVIVLFVVLTAVLSLFIVSGSALWSLLAPVFVPAFMLLGMSPALSQAAFRVGDSAMHIVTPMNPYLLLALAMLREYEPEARFGTMISRLAIFALPFLVVWTLLLALFYTLGLPLGPGSGIHLH